MRPRHTTRPWPRRIRRNIHGYGLLTEVVHTGRRVGDRTVSASRGAPSDPRYSAIKSLRRRMRHTPTGPKGPPDRRTGCPLTTSLAQSISGHRTSHTDTLTTYHAPSVPQLHSYRDLGDCARRPPVQRTLLRPALTQACTNDHTQAMDARNRPRGSFEHGPQRSPSSGHLTHPT